MIKVKLKISGCFQTIAEAEVFAITHYFLSTMRKFTLTSKIIFIVFYIFACSICFALPNSLQTLLIKAKIPNSSISVYIQELTEVTTQNPKDRIRLLPLPVISWQATKAMHPASIMKLVTTWAGWQILGGDYKWSTKIYADQLPQNGVLGGTIYIVGGGDPKLIPEEMLKFMQNLRSLGVDAIDADLVLDKSLFSNYKQQNFRINNEATIDGRITRPYNVAPDSLLYSFNTITFKLKLNEAGVVDVIANPLLPQLKIYNNLAIDNGSCSGWKGQVRRTTDGIVEAVFSGKLALYCFKLEGKEQAYRTVVLNHDEFFWGGFVAAWREAGGKFVRLPNLRLAKTPRQAKFLLEHESRPLSEIVTDINKFSNNVMTRQLFLSLGMALRGKNFGSSQIDKQQIAKLLPTWLNNNGLPMPELVLDNGSGLSRKELISAKSMANLLLQAKNSPWMQSLPVVGVDGTMKYRLLNLPIVGNAFIKTGSLDNVRSIAGYVQTASNKRFLVVSMINHKLAHIAGESIHNWLLNWIYGYL